MVPRMKRILATSLAFGVVVAASAAHADRIYPGGNSSGAVTEIGKSVKELSLETMIVFASNHVEGKNGGPDSKSTELALLGAPVFRYFIVDNVALSLNLGGFFRTAKDSAGTAETKTTDAGFLGTLGAAYYASVGGGMFIAPGVGVGGFVGSRENTVSAAGPGGTDLVSRFSISGVAVRAGLGLVFYSSARFNLFARPEAIVYIGSSKPKNEATAPGVPVDDAASKFTRIDGGFTCGLSYVF
jgi:hypothetical protein